MSSNWIDEQYDELKKLAEKRFAPLSSAETKMLRAAIAGDIAWCGPSEKDDDPHNDPSSTEEWGAERGVRAGVLRWLCIEKTAEVNVDPCGIRIHGAAISGLLDFSNASVRFPLALGYCRFSSDICLRLARLQALGLDGSCVRSIRAESVTIDGYLSLTKGFIAKGSVNLADAQVAGIACNHGAFINPLRDQVQESGIAFVADRARIKGSVHLRDTYIEGLVRLVGAQIDGSLSCNGGTFKNPAQKGLAGSGVALIADCITVKAGVLLNDGFNAEGLVRFVSSHIERGFDCQMGSFKNAIREQVPASGDALMLDGSFVKGNVFLRSGFRAEGAVAMVGVRIEGNLDCHGGIFENAQQEITRMSGRAIRASGIFVQSSAYFGDGFEAKGIVGFDSAKIELDLDLEGSIVGTVDLQRAKIEGSLFIRNLSTGREVLNLSDASVGSLTDNRKSWMRILALDGFVYGRISEGPKDSTSRLEWLGQQGKFVPQSYRQLAKVLRERRGRSRRASCALRNGKAKAPRGQACFVAGVTGIARKD